MLTLTSYMGVNQILISPGVPNERSIPVWFFLPTTRPDSTRTTLIDPSGRLVGRKNIQYHFYVSEKRLILALSTTRPDSTRTTLIDPSGRLVGRKNICNTIFTFHRNV